VSKETYYSLGKSAGKRLRDLHLAEREKREKERERERERERKRGVH